MAKDFLSRLHKLEGAVVNYKNPHENVLRTHSPSVNFIFGNGHGLPRGLTLALGGEPKGGKTLLCKSFIGALHAADPTAYAIRFDTELRTSSQGTPKDDQRIWGIDPDRLITFETNKPDLFDTIEQDIAAMCQDGMNLGLVIIDSISGIRGRRALNADSINVQQIGDEAATLTQGFKLILPVQRRWNFSVILTNQVRMEMDPLEVKRGNKTKMTMPLAVQHYAEMWATIERDRNKDGRTDLMGNEFRNEELGDMNGDGDTFGHKIRMRMKANSCGPANRLAEFTIVYEKGVVNQFEEIFLLGTNRGVIERPNNLSYAYGGKKWTGKPAMLEALKTDRALADAVMSEIYARDKAGAFAADDAAIDTDSDE